MGTVTDRFQRFSTALTPMLRSGALAKPRHRFLVIATAIAMAVSPLMLAQLTFSTPANAQESAQGAQRSEALRVRPDGRPSVVNGFVVGDARVVYSVSVRAGQRLTVSLQSNNRALTFGIFSRGGASIFESEGNRFSAVMRRSGTYAIILEFDETVRRKRASYSLSVALRGGRDEFDEDENDDDGDPFPRPPVIDCWRQLW
jgi:hypothetical protein